MCSNSDVSRRLLFVSNIYDATGAFACPPIRRKRRLIRPLAPSSVAQSKRVEWYPIALYFSTITMLVGPPIVIEPIASEMKPPRYV